MSRIMIAAAATLVTLSAAFANMGDAWTLSAGPPHDGSFNVYPGEGGDGTPAYEYTGSSTTARVYWSTVGTSMPTTTELYEIWYYEPAVGGHSPQFIESQIGGAAGEIYPLDPRIPWPGVGGSNHQSGLAYNGTPGQWNLIDAGPRLPAPHQMWLIGGTSGLYVTWDLPWSTHNTVGALKLVQITPEPATAVLLSLGLLYLRRKGR